MTIPVIEKLTQLWPDAFTDEQLNQFLKATDRDGNEQVIDAIEWHYREKNRKPTPGDIRSRIEDVKRQDFAEFQGTTARLESERRAASDAEASKMSAAAWAATVEDWDLKALLVSMIAADRNLQGAMSENWKKRFIDGNDPIRNAQGLLRQLHAYAIRTGAVQPNRLTA